MKLQRFPNFFKKSFIRNGPWKLLALSIAIFIHFSIRAQLSHTRNVTIPIDIDASSFSQENAIKSKSPEFVSVTLRGSDSKISQLDENKMRCIVRHRSKNSIPSADWVSLKINRKSFEGINGVNLVKIDPKEVRVELDTRMSLNLGIAPITTQGKARGRVDLEYNKDLRVLVTGSRSLLTKVEPEKTLVQPEVVDVEGRSQSFLQTIKLIPPGADANATLEPAELRVEIKITTEKTTRTLEHCPVTVIQPPGLQQRWRVVPAEVKVEVSGRREELDDISYGNVIATVNVDPNNISEGVVTNVPIKVLILHGVKVDQSSPIPATVDLRLLPD